MYLFVKVTIINIATLGIRTLIYKFGVDTNTQSVTDSNAKVSLNYVNNIII